MTNNHTTNTASSTFQHIHNWQLTASPAYRQCAWRGCNALQHLENGIWSDVQEKPASSVQTVQASIWEVPA